MAYRLDTQILKILSQDDKVRMFQNQSNTDDVQNILTKWYTSSVDPYVSRRAKIVSYDINNVENVAILAMTVAASPYKNNYEYNVLSTSWNVFGKLLSYGFQSENTWEVFRDFFRHQWEGNASEDYMRINDIARGDCELKKGYQWCKQIVNYFQCDNGLLNLFDAHIEDVIQYETCDVVRHCYDFFTVSLLSWVISHFPQHNTIQENWVLCLRAWRGTYYSHTKNIDVELQAQHFDERICATVLGCNDLLANHKLMNNHVSYLYKTQLSKQYAQEYLDWLHTGIHVAVRNSNGDMLNATTASLLVDLARINFHLSDNEGYLFFDLLFGISSKGSQTNNAAVWYKVLGSTIEYLIENCNPDCNIPVFLFKVKTNNVYWIHPIGDVELFLSLCRRVTFTYVKGHMFTPMTLHVIRHYNIEFECNTKDERSTCNTLLFSINSFRKNLANANFWLGKTNVSIEKVWVKRIFDTDTGGFHQIYLQNSESCMCLASFLANIAMLDVSHSTEGISEYNLVNTLRCIYNPGLQLFYNVEKGVDYARVLENGLCNYLKGLRPIATIYVDDMHKLERFYRIYQTYIECSAVSLFYVALRAVSFHFMSLNVYNAIRQLVETMYIPNSLLNEQIISLLYPKSDLPDNPTPTSIVKRTIKVMKQSSSTFSKNETENQITWYKAIKHLETSVLPRVCYVENCDISDVSYVLVTLLMKRPTFTALIQQETNNKG